MNRRTFAKGAGALGAASAAGRWAFAAAPDAAAPGAAAPDAADDAAESGKDAHGESPWSVYRLGASYYPEWWDPGEWETDFSQMQALGLNTVRMGEFAWSSYEPAAGKFEFDWMDRAIAIANRHGIRVLLGTPTAAVPPWLYQAHPDVLGASRVQLQLWRPQRVLREQRRLPGRMRGDCGLARGALRAASRRYRMAAGQRAGDSV